MPIQNKHTISNTAKIMKKNISYFKLNRPTREDTERHTVVKMF